MVLAPEDPAHACDKTPLRIETLTFGPALLLPLADGRPQFWISVKVRNGKDHYVLDVRFALPPQHSMACLESTMSELLDIFHGVIFWMTSGWRV